jgi:hypothetical protein
LSFLSSSASYRDNDSNSANNKMVVFVDLDNEIEPPESLTPHWSDPRFEDAARIKEKLAYEAGEDGKDGKGGNANVAVKDKDEATAKRNLNRNAVTEIFACYP